MFSLVVYVLLGSVPEWHIWVVAELAQLPFFSFFALDVFRASLLRVAKRGKFCGNTWYVLVPIGVNYTYVLGAFSIRLTFFIFCIAKLSGSG